MGKLSLSLAFLHPSASPVWPPTGLAIAAMLIGGRGLWPSILLGAFFVNITTAGSLWTSMAIAAGNTCEAIVASMLIDRLARGTRVFERLHGVLVFALFAVIPSTMISATIGMAALASSGYIPLHDVPVTWFTWWLGNSVGAFIMVPLILLWHRHPRIRWTAAQSVEALCLACALLFVASLLFSNVILDGEARYPLAYLSFFPILWAAIRFGPRETISIIFLLAAIAITGTLQGWGPFSWDSPNTSLLFLQSFMALAAFAGMALAAALQEQKDFQEILEENIRERTRDLAIAHDQDRANMERLRNITDQMTIAAVAAGDDMRIIHANDRFCQFIRLGLPSHALQSRLLTDIFEGSREAFLEPDAAMRKILQMLLAGTPVVREDFHMRSGTILSCDYIPTSLDGIHHGHLLVFRDVTEERRIDRAKSEFMSLASHQLRTPLTTIRWSLGRLEKTLEGRATDAEERLLREGKSASVRMGDTINTMLMIARIESGQYQLSIAGVSLQGLVEEIASVYREECRLRGQTLSAICEQKFIVETDEKFLSEILYNLLSNAVKYTRKGGSITLRVQQRDADTIGIDIEDTGIGIPSDEQHRVFQKFFRASNAYEVEQNGTGLGLYLASTAASLLGAELSFVSRAKQGTTFTLLLPHARAAAEKVYVRPADERVTPPAEGMLAHARK